jgi:hypothetical protein
MDACILQKKQDAHFQEWGGAEYLDVPLKKIPAKDKIGELNIMSSRISNFPVSSSILCGMRSFHRTRNGFCMTHLKVIVKGDVAEAETG